MLIVRHLDTQAYEPVWQAMKAHTECRDPESADELWVLEHPAVFTLGLNGKKEHLLQQSDIPLIKVDRGGQITFHGPGQLVIYTLLDIKRLGIGVRKLVTLLEQSIVLTLADYGISANSRPDAPGVYVDGAKIAALGLRIRRHCSYHGLSLNIDMDLSPFSQINPCGYADLEVTDFAKLGVQTSINHVKSSLITHLIAQLGYTNAIQTTDLPTTLAS